MIRVGSRIKNKLPKFPGFKPIVCLTASSPYGHLGPYCLRDAQGRLMENLWQGAKVYKRVPRSRQYYSQWDRRVIWEHPAEIHLRDGVVTQELVNWRAKLFANPDAVRYPATLAWQRGGNVQFSIDPNAILVPGERITPASRVAGNGEVTPASRVAGNGEVTPAMQMDYITARKKIYAKYYIEMVMAHPRFAELVGMHEAGKDLLIIEVDGPRTERMPYYKEHYGVADDFIENDTMLATPANLRLMINDAKYIFGHGYCLAMALMTQEERDYILADSEDISE